MKTEYETCGRPGWAWIENKDGFMEWCCIGHKVEAMDNLNKKKRDKDE